jgi:uncharacterized membrane protein
MVGRWGYAAKANELTLPLLVNAVMSMNPFPMTWQKKYDWRAR